MGEFSKKIIAALRVIRDWQPLTTRGFVALGLSILALEVFALPSSDLIAYMLGGGILAILALALCGCLYTRFRLSKSLSADARFEELGAVSKCPVSGGITLNGSSVPPYFGLRVSRTFKHSGVISPTHRVVGGEPRKRHLIDSVEFPHRGLWELYQINFELGDSLGLTSMSWSKPSFQAIEVSALTLPIRSLPIVAASSRSGDQLSQAKERSGDPFDLKPYDPSDGIKRILWKTFARSGELVVRRPEPAIIPEGEVALYLIANKHEDHVAGALQHYLDKLEQDIITVLFGTDQESPERYFVTESEDISRAINQSVWSPISGTGKGFEPYLEALAASNRSVHQAVVFAPADDRDDWLDCMLPVASAHHIKLSVALVPQGLAPQLAVEQNPFEALKKRSTTRIHAGQKASAAGAEVILCQGLQ